MIRGFSTSRDVVPNFLQAFDVDDGRMPCPLRTRTVTAPLDGIVNELTAKAGQQVRMDEPLTVIGPESADSGSLARAGRKETR